MQGAGRTKGIRVAIAYDSRLKSRDFACISAEVFAASGFQVYMFPELAPTPCFPTRFVTWDAMAV